MTPRNLSELIIDRNDINSILIYETRHDGDVESAPDTHIKLRVPIYNKIFANGSFEIVSFCK